MTTRTTFTDITKANAEIRDMEAHMNVMKRMIAVQSERIDNLKELIGVLKEQIQSDKALDDTRIRLMHAWLNALEKNQVGLVMESIDRTIGNTKFKEII